MILNDDNFATIVSSIHEGRRIFDNIKKYLVYLLSSNISEILILTFAVVMGWLFPLLAKHILYINLATDGSPAIALSMEQSEPDIMRRKPRNPNGSIFFWNTKMVDTNSDNTCDCNIIVILEYFKCQWMGFRLWYCKGKNHGFCLIVFFNFSLLFPADRFKYNIHKLGFSNNKLSYILY